MVTAGQIDDTFPHGLLYGINKNVHDIKIQSDGKILVAGDFEEYDYDGTTFYSPYLCRLNEDGTFESEFSTVVVFTYSQVLTDDEIPPSAGDLWGTELSRDNSVYLVQSSFCTTTTS